MDLNNFNTQIGSLTGAGGAGAVTLEGATLTVAGSTSPSDYTGSISGTGVVQQLGPGTLYGAISRLEAQGFIEPLELEERGRRPYRITASGRRAFDERLAELTRYQSALLELAAVR